MKNQSVSDFVAASMSAVLDSKEHKDLFATQYKKAKDSMCAKHGKMDSCAADDQEAKSKKSSDSSDADDQDAKKKKDSSSDSSSASDMNDARKKKDSDDDSCMADDQDAKKSSKSSSSDSSSADDDNDARKHKKDSSDESSADDDNDARKGKMCKECHKPMNMCKCDKSSADDQRDWDTSKGAGQKLNYDRDGNHYDGLKGHGVGANEADDQNNANTLQSSNSNKYPKNMESGYRNADVLRAEDGEVSAAYDVAIDSLLTASAALDSLSLGRGSALTLKIASLVVEAKKKDKKDKDSKKSSKKSDSQSAKDKKSKDSKKDDKKSSKDSHSAKDKKSDSKSSKDSKKSSSK